MDSFISLLQNSLHTLKPSKDRLPCRATVLKALTKQYLPEVSSAQWQEAQKQLHNQETEAFRGTRDLAKVRSGLATIQNSTLVCYIGNNAEHRLNSHPQSRQIALSMIKYTGIISYLGRDNDEHYFSWCTMTMSSHSINHNLAQAQ